MLTTKFIRRNKLIIFFLLITPSILWSYQFLSGALGVNPIEKLMDELGLMALRLIIATLFISSLAEFRFLRSLIEIRRMIGLFAFYYVCLHFLSYIILDHFFDIQFIIKDIIKRPFITFGFISFLALIPLASTSTKSWIKKLGYKTWKKIHYLIYLAAILSSIHFFMLVRVNKIEPAIYIGLILLLLIYRIYKRIIYPLWAQ
ncbi:MAG: Protein-methionine-sulfoxide reductase heme-binding subunit MsrQ [Alphaproteobacteria bacterium MarineAlpha5_Bin5]|nr:MAG: Protein-methionine-sulfoxide reductase heme-binding subunit MsrQ [Alphaproteobacteria bacterium MarineAlpha5_Bin5]|tara:strand:+ start:811 stop:1416 length:606 start_codon:yes stop_codon:yes gene_type:complete